MIPSLEDRKARTQFKVATRAIDHEVFGNPLDNINLLKLELDDSFNINPKPLSAYDSLLYL